MANTSEIQSKVAESTRGLRIFSSVLLIILAGSAIAGGIMLIADPTGESLNLSQDLLTDTPFEDYFLPGVILMIANVPLALVAAFMTMRNMRGNQWFIAAQGVVLLGWFTAQLIFNPAFYYPPLHLPFIGLGALLVISAIAIGMSTRQRRREEEMKEKMREEERKEEEVREPELVE